MALSFIDGLNFVTPVISNFVCRCRLCSNTEGSCPVVAWGVHLYMARNSLTKTGFPCVP